MILEGKDHVYSNRFQVQKQKVYGEQRLFFRKWIYWLTTPSGKVPSPTLGQVLSPVVSYLLLKSTSLNDHHWSYGTLTQDETSGVSQRKHPWKRSLALAQVTPPSHPGVCKALWACLTCSSFLHPSCLPQYNWQPNCSYTVIAPLYTACFH